MKVENLIRILLKKIPFRDRLSPSTREIFVWEILETWRFSRQYRGQKHQYLTIIANLCFTELSLSEMVRCGWYITLLGHFPEMTL